MGNGMASFYVHSIGHMPISMLWTCTGPSHMGHAKEVLDGYFTGLPPHGQPMEYHWVFFMCIPWASSMGNALGAPHGLSMELHWELSWGMAWHPFMCTPLGICPYPCYGLALALPIWGMPRKCLMGTSLGCVFFMCIPWPSSMANALGPHLHGLSMELHWELSWGMAWLPSMCMPVGICPYPCYGLALVLLIGACQGNA